MKVLFYYNSVYYPGIAILSSYLKRHGHETELLFDPAIGSNHYVNIPFLNNFINQDLLLNKAKRFQPDLIAFSFVTNQFQYVKQIGNALKEALNVPIVVGGVHPTILPEQVIEERWIDILCIGEGEEALLELANKIEKKENINDIQNLWIKDYKGHVHKNKIRPLIQDLDRLPIPDYEMFDRYGLINKRIDVITGRGCINSCSFCINSFKKNFYKGQKYLRRRSVDNVMKEIIFLNNKYKPHQFRFLDDTFAYDIDWLRDFSKEYRDKINKPFRCTISPNTTSEAVVKELHRSNCDIVEMGFQTASYELRSKMMHRFHSNDKVLEICSWLKKYDIKLSLDLIFGTPNENPKDMWETLSFCDKIKIHYTTASLLYPFPKTKILEYSKKEGYIDEKSYQKICEGVGSYHTIFLLKHYYRDDVFKFQSVISIYNRSNFWMKKMLRIILKRKYGLIHKFLNFISVPFNDWYEFYRRVFMIPGMLFKTRRELKK